MRFADRALDLCPSPVTAGVVFVAIFVPTMFAAVAPTPTSGWVSLAAAAQPTVSAEQRLETGFRYPAFVESPGDLSVHRDETGLLVSWAEGVGSRWGFRRTATAGEIDRNGFSLVRSGPSTDGGPSAVAGRDARGWKVVVLDEEGFHGLSVRNLDPETFESTGESRLIGGTAEEVALPDADGAQGRHAAVWLEGDAWSRRLFLARFDEDLRVLDDPPRLLAEGVATVQPSVVWTDGGGWVAWSEAAYPGALKAVALDAAGVPVAEPTVVTTGEGMTDFVAAAWGDDLFLVWRTNSEVRARRIDADGVPAGPAWRLATTVGDEHGLAAAGADTIALVCWRGDHDRIHAVRVGSAAGVLDAEPMVVSGYSVYVRWNIPEPVSLACAWTGEAFVAAWLDWHDPPTARSPAGSPGADAAAIPQIESGAVFARWIRPDGGFETPDPVRISQAAVPNGPPIAAGDGFLLALFDVDPAFVHTLPLDGSGQPLHPPARFESPARCDQFTRLCWCENVVGRTSTSGEPIVAYEHYWWQEGEWYWMDGSEIVIDRVRADGTPMDRSRLGTGDPPERIDLAATDPGILLIWSEHEAGAPPTIRAALRAPGGSTLRAWGVVADAPADPTVVGVDGGFLAAWTESPGGISSLRTHVFAVADPDTVKGSPVPSAGLAPSRPWFVPGAEGRSLLVFTDLQGAPGVHAVGRLDGAAPTAAVPDFWEIRAQRYSSAGTLVDPEPIVLHSGFGDPGFPRGAWTGQHYLIIWRDGTTGSLVGLRLDEDGALVDDQPFHIGDQARGWDGAFHIAANGDGDALVTAAGSRMWSITEPPIPVLDARLEASVEPQGIRLSWQPIGLRLLGYRILREDAAGERRRIHDADLISAAGPPEVVDRQVVAGARYVYNLTGVTPEGDALDLGSAEAVAGAGAPPWFALLPVAPNPSHGEFTLTFRTPVDGPVRLEIVDPSGRRVARLLDGPVRAGERRVPWRARGLASGVYTVRLQAGGRTATRTLTLIR